MYGPNTANAVNKRMMIGTTMPRVRRTASSSTTINMVPNTTSMRAGLPWRNTCSCRVKLLPRKSKFIPYQVTPMYRDAAIPATMNSQSQIGTLP